jgi:hypothetical protein
MPVCAFVFSSVENSAASHYMLGLAERVAESGDVLNVAECLEVEKGSGGNIRSLLAMPIRNRHYQIIGECGLKASGQRGRQKRTNPQPFEEESGGTEGIGHGP